MGILSANDLKIVTERLKRKPNSVEAGIFSVMWSEHCSYRTSKPFLSKIFTDSPRKLAGPGENAGALDIGDGYFVAFKMESHNHPSAIEPYQGAATGIGGILRDIFTMGARPVASTDPLRFGHMNDPHSRHLLEEVVRGVSDYGNSVGVPTLCGETQFDDSYGINCLVNVFALGIGRTDEIIKGRASGTGNLVLYFGSKTGRDGVDGAFFASDELTEESKKNRPSVQIANPFQEKKVIEACMEIAQKHLVVAMQDMGAAGLTSSSVEMAERGNVGISMDLSKVPLRQNDVTHYEMMLSETQERMLAIVEPGRLKEITAVLKRHEVDWAVIGEVIDEPALKLFDGDGESVAVIPLESLQYDVPPAGTKREKRELETAQADLSQISVPSAVKKLVASDLINSKHWIYEQYDSRVGADTVRPPGNGFSVLRVMKTKKALSITNLGLEDWVQLEPYNGGFNTVVRSALEHYLGGFTPIGITDCLNYGNPEKPHILEQFAASVKGMSDAAELLSVPIVSGNVSLYNENEKGAVKPLLQVGMVGLIEDIGDISYPEFQKTGSRLYLLELSDGVNSPTVASKVLFDNDQGAVPRIDQNALKEFISNMEKILPLVSSARMISRGGLALALFKMCLENRLAFEIPKMENGDLFKEYGAAMIFEIDSSLEKKFLSLTATLSPKHIGTVTAGDDFIINGEKIKKAELIELYSDSFGRNFL